MRLDILVLEKLVELSVVSYFHPPSFIINVTPHLCGASFLTLCLGVISLELLKRVIDDDNDDDQSAQVLALTMVV